MVAVVTVGFASVAWAPPAQADVLLLTGFAQEESGAGIPGATVSAYQPFGGPLVESQTTDATGAFEFLLEPGSYELRGSTSSGWTGTLLVNNDGTGGKILVLRPLVPITVEGNVPVVDGALPSVTLSCAPDQAVVDAEADGAYSVTVMAYPTSSCSIDVEATPYDGRVHISRSVTVVEDPPGSFTGTADFAFPGLQILRFVNPDGSPAQSGTLSASSSQWVPDPDGTGGASVDTSLNWDLSAGDARMLVARPWFRFDLSLPNGYRTQDLSIISDEPGGLLFTVPEARRIHITGYAPVSDDVPYAQVIALCGNDEAVSDVDLVEQTYVVDFMAVDTGQCEVTFETFVTDASVYVQQTVHLVDGSAEADFSLPNGLVVTVADAAGTPVTGGYLSLSSSGILDPGNGTVLRVGTNSRVALDGGPQTVLAARMAVQPYEVTRSDGPTYYGTVDTRGLWSVDLILAPFVRIDVEGRVEDWDAAYTGRVNLLCGQRFEDGYATAPVAPDGSYVVSVNAFAMPSCSGGLEALADGTSISVSRRVDIGMPNDGVATGRAAFGAIPDPMTLHAVDGSGAPVALSGSVYSSEIGVTMPDGALANVSGGIFDLAFTGSGTPVEARLPRTADGSYSLSDGDQFSSAGVVDFSGTGDMTFVTLPGRFGSPGRLDRRRTDREHRW